MNRILFVCMGNICRSPMAEVVARNMAGAKSAGSGKSPYIFDSAGTHAGHIGEAPDPRAQKALVARGYTIGKLRSRRIGPKDFDTFDLMVAMDDDNIKNLQRSCPPQHQHKIKRLLDFAPDIVDKNVPDPYYGNQAGFERVLDLCEIGVRAFLASATPQTR